MKRLLLLLLMLVSCLSAAAQNQPSPISDEQRRFLEVRRQQISLSSARTALQRMQELFSLGLIPRTDLDRVQTEVDMAQLNYQEADDRQDLFRNETGNSGFLVGTSVGGLPPAPPGFIALIPILRPKSLDLGAKLICPH